MLEQEDPAGNDVAAPILLRAASARIPCQALWYEECPHIPGRVTRVCTARCFARADG